MSMSPRLLRPRESFTPKSISGLALWLDASDASTLFQNSDGTTPATTAGDPVGYWADKSGNNRHATQATAASRPTVTTASGRKALAFDGANGWMKTDRTTYAARSVFAVFRRTATVAQSSYKGPFAKQAGSTDASYGGAASTSAQPGGWSGTASGGNNRLYWNSNALTASFHNGASISVADSRNYQVGFPAPIDTTTPAILYAEVSGEASGNQCWFVGTEPYGVTRKYPADFCEALIYNRAITSTERRKIEVYLANRWGITLAPQVSDPDAQDWIDRVYAAGSTVSQSAAAAVNTFVVGCKDDGIWTAMRKVLLLIGVDTFAGCAAYLKGTAPTFTNFSSANYSRTAGLQGVNTGYIRAAMRVSDLTASSSMHLAAWQTAANTAAATTFLAIGQGGAGYLRDNVTNTWIRANSAEILTINARGNAGTMIGMTRNSTTQYGIINGTVTSGASTVNDTGTTTEYDLMGSGTSSSYLGRVSFFSFGDGIDLATLNARVSTLMSTLGSL